MAEKGILVQRTSRHHISPQAIPKIGEHEIRRKPTGGRPRPRAAENQIPSTSERVRAFDPVPTEKANVEYAKRTAVFRNPRSEKLIAKFIDRNRPCTRHGVGSVALCPSNSNSSPPMTSSYPVVAKRRNRNAPRIRRDRATATSPSPPAPAARVSHRRHGSPPVKRSCATRPGRGTSRRCAWPFAACRSRRGSRLRRWACRGPGRCNSTAAWSRSGPQPPP